MPTPQIAKYAGWVALAAGILGLSGLLFLILFFALELPQGDSSSLRFGYLSDVTPIIVAPLNLIVTLVVFMMLRKPAPALSALALLLGVAGILLIAWTNIMFLSARITLEQQVQWFYISLIFLGSWHILVNLAARKAGSLPGRLTTFGIWVGTGQMVLSLDALLLGRFDLLTTSLEEIARSLPLLILLVIGVPMAGIGYLGAPIWLVWLGRDLTARRPFHS